MPYSIEVVAFHITKYCSHACGFCYASSSPKLEHPPANQLERVINAISHAGVRELIFLGGDPGTHPQLLELAAISHEAGMTNTVLSNTHHYLISNPERAILLVDCLESTFHGPDAHMHDTVSGVQGSFDSLLKNLAIASDCGAKSVGIVYNITASSAGFLYDTVAKVHAWARVDHVVLQRLIPQGRGKSTTDCVMTPTAVADTFAEVERIAGDFGIKIVCEDAFPLCSLPQKYHKYVNRCEWGFTRASVDMNGKLSRCGAETNYALGNILDRPLVELWNSNAELEKFRRREYLPSECRKCHLLEKCGGGCSLACETGDGFSPDYLMRHTLIHDQMPMTVRNATVDDLSAILRVEWASFADYPFSFSAESLERWRTYNPWMFDVLVDQFGEPHGYMVVVPLTSSGYEKLVSGVTCSIDQLNTIDVEKTPPATVGGLLHIEVIAVEKGTPPLDAVTLLRALHRKVQGAARITATPATHVGRKLINTFDFKPVAVHHSPAADFEVYEKRQ